MDKREIIYIYRRFFNKNYHALKDIRSIYYHKNYEINYDWAYQELYRYIVCSPTDNYYLLLSEMLNLATLNGNRWENDHPSCFLLSDDNRFYTLYDIISHFLDFLEDEADAGFY